MMKNKYFITAAFLAAALLGGCADSSISAVSEVKRSQTGVDETLENGEADANKSDTTVINAGSSPKASYESSGGYAYDDLNNFGYKLFAENMEEENPVLSPVSAYAALSMAGIGAGGKTKEEFAAVMGDSADMAEICGNIMNTLPTASEMNTVSIANSAWIDDRLEVNKNWLEDIDKNMSSEVFEARLSASGTVDKMNKWIDKKTKGLIKDMIKEPFPDMARLVLFNTLYFKAKWESPFEASDAWTDKFYRDVNDAGSEISVDMMHRQESMDYIENDFAKGVILPYIRSGADDGNFAFVALKPADESMKVRDMYKKLSPSVMSKLLADKTTELVNMKLPKFEIEFDKELNESLISMGLNDAFDQDAADFSGIGFDKLTGSGNNLYISLVRQKAKIIVDEEGTEAAAATMVLVECGAAMPAEEPKEVFFDRPFVYIVMDMDSEMPLFIGILDCPEEVVEGGE